MDKHIKELNAYKKKLMRQIFIRMIIKGIIFGTGMILLLILVKGALRIWMIN